MGKGERSRAETQAHNISSRQKENRRRSAGEVGEGEGAAPEDFLEPDTVLAVNLALAVSQRCESGIAKDGSQFLRGETSITDSMFRLAIGGKIRLTKSFLSSIPLRNDSLLGNTSSGDEINCKTS